MIIGICGQKNNGKSTVANMLMDRLNVTTLFGFSVTGFAHPLKRILGEITGIPSTTVSMYKNSDAIPPGFNVTMRKALQMFGQCVRDIKSEAWIDLVLNDPVYPQSMIIDDVRYLNELEAIKKKGGYNILVIDPKRINRDSHPSEQQLLKIIEYSLDYYTECKRILELRQPIHKPQLFDEYRYKHLIDYLLINNKTLIDLKRQVEEDVSLCILNHIKTD